MHMVKKRKGAQPVPAVQAGGRRTHSPYIMQCSAVRRDVHTSQAVSGATKLASGVSSEAPVLFATCMRVAQGLAWQPPAAVCPCQKNARKNVLEAEGGNWRACRHHGTSSSCLRGGCQVYFLAAFTS